MQLMLPAADPQNSNITFYDYTVGAGFPSPSADYVEGRVDLNVLLIKRPSATFLVRISGNSMVRAGIHSGDIVICDRSIRPTGGRVVVAVLEGELVVKRLLTDQTGTWLISDADGFERTPVREDSAFEIWGVVTYCLHNLT
jgi:DNA polymerase V